MPENQKFAIFEIIEYKNRFIYFYTHDIPTYFIKDSIVHRYSIK